MGKVVRMAVLLLLGCSDLPVKYETCKLDGTRAVECRAVARFEDFELCEVFKRYRNAGCDIISRPGYAECELNMSRLTTGYCTR